MIGLNGAIIDTLHSLGLSEELKSLIVHCISSAILSINWNGSSTDNFKFTRGLK